MSAINRCAGIALVLIPFTGPAAAATAVDYVDFRASYQRASLKPLPPNARTYSVTVDTESGIVAEDVRILGLERASSAGDLQVAVDAEPAAMADSQLQSFNGVVAYVVNGNATPPIFNYTIYWHDIVVAQSAEVAVKTADGSPGASSGPIALTWPISLGKPDKIATGMFQLCAGPRCVMQSEPASSPELAGKRMDYLIETFATDVALNGALVAGGARERAATLVTQAREKLANEPQNPYSAEVTQRVNAWLEDSYGSGERQATLAVANVKSDARFATIMANLGDGTAVDATARRTDAIDAWRVVAADTSVKPRIRAAALYNCAVLEGVEGRMEDARRDLDAAEMEGAGEKDGMFGTKHGALLVQRIVQLREWLTDRGPAPEQNAGG